MQHDVDPKQEIIDRMKPFIDEIHVMGEDVLLGVYMRPEKTKGGLLLAQQSRQEDEYQGLACVILKMGVLAFVEDETHKYGDRKPQVGDWVAVKKSQGFSFKIGVSSTEVQPCRLMHESGIKLIISEPDMVW
jgi:co-chaperonin GroES (HSP10)